MKFVSKKFFLDVELMFYFIKNNMSFFFIPVKYNIKNESSIKFFSLNSFKIMYELIKVIRSLRRQI